MRLFAEPTSPGEKYGPDDMAPMILCGIFFGSWTNLRLIVDAGERSIRPGNLQVFNRCVPPGFAGTLEMKLSNLWRKKKASPYGFFGSYASWEEALAHSTGYTAASVIQGTLERRRLFMESLDSPNNLLDERTQQLLSVVAVLLSERPLTALKVLDFGGSFAAYYYLLRRALPHLKIEWTVVETEEMVQSQQPFVESGLQWRSSLPEPSEAGDKIFDLCWASSSLPYVPEPYLILKKLVQLGRFVAVTRTMFIDDSVDKIAVQRIPPEIFTGSYPAWFFSREKFIASAQKLGRLKINWDVPQDTFLFEGKKIIAAGYLIECR